VLKALIVTVAYNPPASVVQNLEIDFYPHLVVDNSDQETIWLKDYCNQHGHEYRWLGENLGIAKALNVGAEYAIQQRFEYIVTMDQDSELTQLYLFDMEHFIDSYALVNNVSVFSPTHLVGEEQKSFCKYSVEKTIHTMASGNFVFLKSWSSLKGFDEKLFIDAVDTDFYIRSLLSDQVVLVCKHIFLRHRMGNMPTSRWIGKYGFDVWNHSAVRKYYIARNYTYIVNKYLKYLPEVKYYQKIIYKMPISIILFEDDKLRKLWCLFYGYFDFLRGKYGKFKSET
jgi:rhamnosyltransferase